MNKKQLRTFAINARKNLTQKINNEEIVFKTFLFYIYIRYMNANGYLNIDITDKKQYQETVDLCKEKMPSVFYGNSLYLLDYVNDDIVDDEYESLEVLGWLFQYFNITLKEKAYDLLRNNQKITSDKVSVATQVFTPKWIVKYMINNSLGLLLNSNEKEYIINKNVSVEIKRLEEIKIIDPCMGTGNIIIYAFDILMESYLSKGYNETEAFESIVSNNIYGIEIDKRAYDIVVFSLLMLARKYKSSISVFPNICLIDNQYGSLLKQTNIKVLSEKYDVVCTNPPYMGRKNINKDLKTFVDENYPLGKSELYAVFILRCLELVKPLGFVAMITIHSWMFISSFKELRKKIIDDYFITSMIHTGAGTFEDLNSFNALATTFIIQNVKTQQETTFVRLSNYHNYEVKQVEVNNLNNYYYLNAKLFKDIPNYPFIYYENKKIFNLFKNCIHLKDIYPIRQGIATGDNKKYVRLWYEVPKEEIFFDAESITDALNSNYKYFPYNKGGNFCKWYGNSEYIIKFDKKAYEELNSQGNHLPSKQYYFKKGITWSLFGFENFGVKYKDKGFLFDVSGSSMFVEEKYLYYVLAFLASNLCFKFLSLLAPTVNFQVGNIGDLPFIINDEYLDKINSLTIESITLAKENWDNQDISWDFTISPLLKYSDSKTLRKCFKAYEEKQINMHNKLKANEEELNKIFNEIYDIDCNCQVIDRDNSIKLLNEKREIYNFLNYLVGIMLGRYHLKNYQSHKYIKYQNITIELETILTILFGKENLIDNINYINSIIDINKYFSKEFMPYLNSRFRKRPIYYYLDILNDKYLVSMDNINGFLKDFDLTGKIVLKKEDDLKTKIEKIDYFFKNYTKN